MTVLDKLALAGIVLVFVIWWVIKDELLDEEDED